MIDDFAAIEDLIRADNPLERAWEQLVPIDGGEHASIFAHPTDPDLVVRVSDYPDGFFGYADLVIDAREDGAVAGLEHAPFVRAMAIRDGFHVAVCDRLDPVSSEDDEAIGWIAVATALLRGETPDPAALAAFETAQPGFRSFAAWLPESFRDLREGNFLLRGRTLVLNDPSGAMSHSNAAALAEKFGPPRPAFAGP